MHPKWCSQGAFSPFSALDSVDNTQVSPQQIAGFGSNPARELDPQANRTGVEKGFGKAQFASQIPRFSKLFGILRSLM